jgi:hypothetical protein
MIQSSLFAEPGRPGRGSAGGAVVRICREERDFVPLSKSDRSPSNRT